MVSRSNLIAGVVLVVLFAGIIAFLAYSRSSPGNYDSFAQCLTDSGAKMYGAFWCPHCSDQKKAFGNSWQYVTYVECSNADRSQNEICNAAGIKGYPTWQFGNGQRGEGFLSFQQLSTYSGCPLP